MNTRRTIITLVQILVLIAVAIGIYELTKSAPEPGNDQEVQGEVAVHYGEISRQTVRRYLTVYGVVAAAPAASAHLTLPWNSIVTDVDCAQGQHVKKGQVLYSIAQLNPDGSRHGGIPISSPLTGTVVNLLLQPGEAANPQTEYVDIVDLDRLVIEANVPADQMQKVKIAQAVEIMSDMTAVATTMPSTEPSMPSAVSVVDLQIDPRTNMGSIDATVPGGAGLRLGQFVAARIVLEEHQNVLTVPAEAIVKDIDGKTQINLVKADVALPLPVTVVLRDGDVVEIQAPGIAEKMAIVTTGAFSIIEHAKLHEIGDDSD